MFENAKQIFKHNHLKKKSDLKLALLSNKPSDHDLNLVMDSLMKFIPKNYNEIST